MDVWIGTAGYAYPAWVGRFYPAGTPSAAMLGHYATHFPVVEINSSFYKPPSPQQVANMLARTPAGFRFALKVPRSSSHEFRPDELALFHLAAGQLGDRLAGLLVQFAETFPNTRPNRDWLSTVRDRLRPFPLAVEFRHFSWDVPALPDWLRQRDLDVVSVGVPAVPTLFPAGLRVVGERLYARLHSQDANAWYAGGPARYDYDYPDAVIGKWAAGVAAAAERGVLEVLFFFNNCVGVQAVENARKLAAKLAGVPGVNVIQPPDPPRERTLFDDV